MINWDDLRKQRFVNLGKSWAKQILTDLKATDKATHAKYYKVYKNARDIDFYQLGMKIASNIFTVDDEVDATKATIDWYENNLKGV